MGKKGEASGERRALGRAFGLRCGLLRPDAGGRRLDRDGDRTEGPERGEFQPAKTGSRAAAGLEDRPNGGRSSRFSGTSFDPSARVSSLRRWSAAPYARYRPEIISNPH